MHTVSAITKLELELPCEDIFYHIYTSLNPGYCSFLDSSLHPNKYSRFSYIAWEPDFALRGYGHVNELVNCKNGSVLKTVMHPMLFLRKKLSEYVRYTDSKKELTFFNKKTVPGELPDFPGGFIGYFSYDLKDYLEKLPGTVIDDIKLPLYYLVYYSRFLVYDHQSNSWYLIIRASDDRLEELEKMISEEKDRIDGLLVKINCKNENTPGTINKKIRLKYLEKNIDRIQLKSNFSKNDYLRSVKRAKRYIHEGDIYQVNMTQRFSCLLDIEPVDVYYILRQKNPAPFSAFLGFPDFKIGSSSPERFLFLKDGVIETRPIKGTRPRGRNSAEEKVYSKELKNSIKDRAELNMIVDLERNDLGKFSKYGTVKVKQHAVIEKFARVQHLVSTVVGKVKEGYDIVDIIKATFPGGSITGAPKIRAMQIIDELEPTARSVYTGAIGYIGADSTMDLNIVIRTFIIKDRMFYYNVGGGIVEDSEPEEEFQETLDKGIALKETLEYFSIENLSKKG
jgi:para-aminobenzoate synthetase component 1